MMQVSDTVRARWAVASRVLAGTLGAYGLTSLFTAAFSLIMTALGMDRVQAVYTATLASFAIFALIAIAVFHARSVRRVWGWLFGSAMPLALLSWLLMHRAAL